MLFIDCFKTTKSSRDGQERLALCTHLSWRNADAAGREIR